MHRLAVELPGRRYSIAFAPPAALAEFARQAAPGAAQVVVVADANVEDPARRAAAELGASLVVVPPGERSKSLAELARLYDRFAELRLGRSALVVAFGGGVVGDLAGFAAATYNRGLRLLMVPTTLLSMVDSSVGGKVGVNLSAGKNLVGAFHQPCGVFIDLGLLGTLPGGEFRSGLAEVVKYGAALDPEFLAELERDADSILARDRAALSNVVARSCRIKAEVVAADEFETTGRRAALNFGHTFGHAYEAVAGYGAWRHGEAVAAGMVAACELAHRMGRVGPELGARVAALLERFGLPTAPDPSWDVDAILAAMRTDKKADAAGLRFVLPGGPGGAAELVGGVPEALVRGELGARLGGGA